MGGKAFTRALVWAFATHGVLIAGVALNARRPPVHIADVDTFELHAIDLALIHVDPPADSEPVQAPPRVTPSARAPRAKPIAAPVIATRALEDHAAASEAATDLGTASSSEEAIGTDSAARPQTAVASSHAPVATHGPILIGRDGCRHYFPHEAQSERGTVTVAIDVSPNGAPTGARIVQESPPRNGFGEAAARCARSLQFVPAIAENGLPVRAVATLELHFARSRRRDTLSLR